MEEPKKIREKAIDKLIEKIKEERKLKPKISLMDFSSAFQPDCTPTRKEKVSSKIILIDKGRVVLDTRTGDLKNLENYTDLEGLFRSLREESEVKRLSYENLFD